MRRDTNTLIIEGHLVKDVELKQVGDFTIGNFSIANNQVRKNGNEYVDSVSFFNVTSIVSAKLADYLKKGQPVLIEGSIVQDRWDKDGHKYSAVKIRATSIKLQPSAADHSAEEAETEYQEDVIYASDAEVDPDNYFG